MASSRSRRNGADTTGARSARRPTGGASGVTSPSWSSSKKNTSETSPSCGATALDVDLQPARAGLAVEHGDRAEVRVRPDAELPRQRLADLGQRRVAVDV